MFPRTVSPIGAIVGAIVILFPRLLLGQVQLPVPPPATPSEGWGLVVAVLVAGMLGAGTVVWLILKRGLSVTDRHLKLVDEIVATQKTIDGSLHEVAGALKAHREEAEARARSAEERNVARHSDVLSRIDTLRSELGISERLSRIEAATANPVPRAPADGPLSARGAQRLGG